MVRGVRGSGARGNRNNPQTYKNDNATTTNNKVTTGGTTESVNKPKHKKKFVRNNQGMNNRMSYPLRDSPSERTGDRLMIRCLEFSPPEDGSGLNISLRNAFKKDSKGNLSAIIQDDRDLIKANKMTIEQPTADGKGTYNMKHDDKMAIDFKNTDTFVIPVHSLLKDEDYKKVVGLMA